jgi:hypothetical protein
MELGYFLSIFERICHAGCGELPTIIRREQPYFCARVRPFSHNAVYVAAAPPLHSVCTPRPRVQLRWNRTCRPFSIWAFFEPKNSSDIQRWLPPFEGVTRLIRRSMMRALRGLPVAAALTRPRCGCHSCCTISWLGVHLAEIRGSSVL